MLSAGDMFLTMFPWNSVQRKNHEILQAAYEMLKKRVQDEEASVVVRFNAERDAFTAPGERRVCEDTSLGYISVYTKQDNSARFFGIPSTYSYAAHALADGYVPTITKPAEVQFQYNPSNQEYQAVVFNKDGSKIFTFTENGYTNYDSDYLQEYNDTVQNICDTPISSALKALGQCQE